MASSSGEPFDGGRIEGHGGFSYGCMRLYERNTDGSTTEYRIKMDTLVKLIQQTEFVAVEKRQYKHLELSDG